MTPNFEDWVSRDGSETVTAAMKESRFSKLMKFFLVYLSAVFLVLIVGLTLGAFVFYNLVNATGYAG